MRATTRPLGLKQGDVAGESEVLWLDNSLELNDGKEYEYVYDPFGRLRKIKNTSNQALVAEYWYNGLGHRITWHSDTSRSGGGAPDGTVDTNDPKVHFIYNERWQQVATYRQANGSNIDTHPRDAGRPMGAQFVNHAAGLAGYGSSSYIDGVILRDDHEDDWTEAADSTMERRVYCCQKWRADVIAILAENGRIVEKAWYEPYGTPHGLNPGDFGGTSSSGDDHYLVPDGDSDADDGTTYLALFGASNALSDTTGSSDPGDGEYGRPNGVIDSDDYFYFLDRAGDAAALGRNVLSAGHDGATASHGAGNLRNRKGLAGYGWDPHVRRYHVRNRVLYPEIGRWTRRDPLGYVDGVGLYEYVTSRPLGAADPSGWATCWGSCGQGNRTPRIPPSDEPSPEPVTPPDVAPDIGITVDECNSCASQGLDEPGNRALISEMQMRGCGRPAVTCTVCGADPPSHRGWTDPDDSSITLCADRIPDCEYARQIVTHELYHAYDLCLGRIPRTGLPDCAACVCAELRAYRWDRGCSDGGPRRTRPGPADEPPPSSESECLRMYVRSSCKGKCNAEQLDLEFDLHLGSGQCMPTVIVRDPIIVFVRSESPR